MTPTEDSRPDGTAPYDDAATADALRQALAAEAADVHPSPDALQTIRGRLTPDRNGELGSTALGAGTTTPGRRSWMLGALGAAAATVAIIGGVVYVGQQGGPSGQPESGGLAAGGQTRTHSGSPSQSVSSAHPRRHRFPGPPAVPSSKPSDAPTASQNSRPSSGPTQTPTSPASSQSTSPSSSGRRPWVSITSPADGANAANPVTVRGSANVFEANVNWKLLSAQGRVLQEGHATAGFMQWKPFTVRLGTLKPGTYTVRAYEASAKSGNPTHVDAVTFTVR